MSWHYIQKESKSKPHHLAWGTCPAQSHLSTQVPAGSNYSTACKSHDGGNQATHMPSKSFWAKSSFTGEEDERDAGEASPDDEAGSEPPEGVSVKTTLGHVRRLASEVGVELCTRSTSAVVWRPNACATSKAVLPSLFLSEGLAPASKRTWTTDVWPAIQVRRGSKGMGGRFEAGGAPWLAAPMRAVPPAAHCIRVCLPLQQCFGHCQVPLDGGGVRLY